MIFFWKSILRETNSHENPFGEQCFSHGSVSRGVCAGLFASIVEFARRISPPPWSLREGFRLHHGVCAKVLATVSAWESARRGQDSYEDPLGEGWFSYENPRGRARILMQILSARDGFQMKLHSSREGFLSKSSRRGADFLRKTTRRGEGILRKPTL